MRHCQSNWPLKLDRRDATRIHTKEAERGAFWHPPVGLEGAVRAQKLSTAARRSASNRISLRGADEDCCWRRYALKKKAVRLTWRQIGSIRACRPRTTARATALSSF